MKNLTELKQALAKRILDCDDEDQLRTVDQLMGGEGSFTLTSAQRLELDADFADFVKGKGKNYTWAEVKAHARGGIGNGA